MRSVTLFGRRRQPAPQAHAFWRFAYPAVVVAAGIAVLLLVLEGGRAVLNTTVDEVQENVVLEPDEPGYLEFVGATPTLLSLHTHNGGLTGVAFMARTGINVGGGVVLLPADLLVVPQGAASEQGERLSDTNDRMSDCRHDRTDGEAPGELLSDTYDRGGAEAVVQVAEAMLGIGFDQVVEVPTEWLAHSMGPAAPLPYLLLDDLTEAGPDGAQQVVYEAGRQELTAADAAAVYALRNPDEADVNRVQRQRAMWESWLDVIGRAEEPEAVIPPADSPLSPFLRALGAGTAVVEVVPLQSYTPDPGSTPVPLLGAESWSWLEAKALELVPWPRQPESFLRPRVQLLDGTGDPSIRDSLADDVVAAGGVITVIGNADTVGVEDTHFAYYREDLVTDPITNCIALRLGVDMFLIEPGEGIPDVVDITVTVGRDQAGR